MRTSLPCLAGLLLISTGAHAQDTTDRAPPNALAEVGTSITLPQGTRLLTELQVPIHTRSAKPGDSVYLQTTFPVSDSSGILIPAGTQVLATLDEIKAHWSEPLAVELKLQVSSLLYANGYIATATVPAHGKSSSDAGLRSEPRGPNAAAVLGTAAALIGAGIGASANGTKGAAVGGLAGSVAGTAVVLFSAARSRRMILDAGLPLELLLDGPIAVDARRAAAPAPPSNLVRLPFARPGNAREKLCFNPGTPGTPDIIIPGSPGTPPSGDMAGIPPTPPTIIPGTPATPGYWHSCP